MKVRERYGKNVSLSCGSEQVVQKLNLFSVWVLQFTIMCNLILCSFCIFFINIGLNVFICKGTKKKWKRMKFAALYFDCHLIISGYILKNFKKIVSLVSCSGIIYNKWPHTINEVNFFSKLDLWNLHLLSYTFSITIAEYDHTNQIYFLKLNLNRKTF